jgi:chromosome segregation ATPase
MDQLATRAITGQIYSRQLAAVRLLSEQRLTKERDKFASRQQQLESDLKTGRSVIKTLERERIDAAQRQGKADERLDRLEQRLDGIAEAHAIQTEALWKRTATAEAASESNERNVTRLRSEINQAQRQAEALRKRTATAEAASESNERTVTRLRDEVNQAQRKLDRRVVRIGLAAANRVGRLQRAVFGDKSRNSKTACRATR